MEIVLATFCRTSSRCVGEKKEKSDRLVCSSMNGDEALQYEAQGCYGVYEAPTPTQPRWLALYSAQQVPLPM